MDEYKKIDTRKSIKVVTANSVIEARGISDLKLNARKLFYIAVSQCQRDDTEFYTYATDASELASVWGIEKNGIYATLKEICAQLMKITIILRKGAKGFKMRHLFDRCEYDEESKVVSFRLHPEMSDLLLGLKKDFSKPLMWEFMRMRSVYSIELWHYFQKEMKSFKPTMSNAVEFDVTLDDLRRVTGTENKLKQIGEFKSRVLDTAIKEIRHNCMVDITYTNIKLGRKVVGFRFTAKNVIQIDADNLSVRSKKRIRKAELINKKANKTITAEEYDELQNLSLELDQLTLEDIASGGF